VASTTQANCIRTPLAPSNFCSWHRNEAEHINKLKSVFKSELKKHTKSLSFTIISLTVCIVLSGMQELIKKKLKSNS
jgi:hypothetical protein